MRNELKLLIAFLKQNNAYSKYRHNIRRDIFFLLNASGSNPYNIIVISFDWFSTLENFPYWNKLDDKWRIFYNNNKRERINYGN